MPRKARSDNPTTYINLGKFKKTIVAAADAKGMDLTTYIRSSAIEQARRDGFTVEGAA